MSPAVEQWKAAKEALDTIENERAVLLAPTRQRFEAAQERLAEIEEVTGAHMGWCEGCGRPLFERDRYHVGADVCLCEECCPSYADMLASPQLFRDAEDEPLSAEAARAIVDVYIAAGGSIEDKVL